MSDRTVVITGASAQPHVADVTSRSAVRAGMRQMAIDYVSTLGADPS